MSGRSATVRPHSGKITRLAYRALGVIAFSLAVAGVVLPGLPATPFLLAAVWAFNRGASEWAERIEHHPCFGPLLRNWRDRRVVPRKEKFLVIGSMIVSFAILWASSTPLLVLIALGAILCTVATYLFSRPSN